MIVNQAVDSGQHSAMEFSESARAGEQRPATSPIDCACLTQPMGKKHNTDGEFPVLAGLGLYAGNIVGDGNCLFRALSDQMWGHQENYAKIRQAVVDYIRSDQARFEPFTCVYGESFDVYTNRMADDATYGGHLEIVAFSEVHKAQVFIYQSDLNYAVNPTTGDPVQKIHIAYHTWEHYSSVRNKAGPHSGIPDVDPTPCEVPPQDTSAIPQWKVDIVLRSVDVSEERARQLLQKKDYNDVIEDLLMEPDAAAEPAVEPEAEAAKPEPEPEPEHTHNPIEAVAQTSQKVKRKASKKKKDFEQKWQKKKDKKKGTAASAASPGGSSSSSSSAAASGGPIFI